MNPKQPKAKKCKCGCGEYFVPTRPMQVVASPLCAIRLVEKKKEREFARAKKIERRETREKLLAMKTISQLKKITEKECHAFVRVRDEGKGCITCGTPLLKLGRVGGDYDAGHYRTRAAADHLRYDERNIHGQCKDCNWWGAGKSTEYRKELINRIGLAEVEALENDNRTIKWTREKLLELAEYFRAKRRALEKEKIQ